MKFHVSEIMTNDQIRWIMNHKIKILIEDLLTHSFHMLSDFEVCL